MLARMRELILFFLVLGISQASRSLCSGYSTTFSALGEVYAWLGEGSLEAERRACCEFAEAIADGRTVTVLPEGEETAMFWHHLPDDNEYASAQVRLDLRALPGQLKPRD
jgi:hypothetical protein